MISYKILIAKISQFLGNGIYFRYVQVLVEQKSGQFSVRHHPNRLIGVLVDCE